MGGFAVHLCSAEKDDFTRIFCDKIAIDLLLRSPNKTILTRKALVLALALKSLYGMCDLG